MSQKKNLLLVAMLFLCGSLFGQVSVRGVVLDEQETPIIGASIIEVGTSNGTITNFDGEFMLTVAEGAMLQISYVGYKDLKVKATPSMTIHLEEDVEVLEEVVVTGYTTQRKADLSGAVSVMDMDKPISQASPNMLNSLQGRLAGVQINTDAAPGGGGTSIRVRGMSTINGNDPLYVIDGGRPQKI